MLLQKPSESVEGWVVGCAKAVKDSAQQFFFLGDVDCVSGVVQCGAIDIDSIFADGSVDGAEADADAKLTHAKFIMHIPKQVGNDKGIGKQSLKFIAESDDKAREQGTP